MNMDGARVQITVRPVDVDRARRVLSRVEGEIEKDWRYADFPYEALNDIKALVEALHGVLGSEEPQRVPATEPSRVDKRTKPFRKGQGSGSYLPEDKRKKLTREQVAEIRARYAQGVVTQQSLANEYGVNQSHISGIIRGVCR